MYKVIKYFEDLQDDNHPYKVGDVFPRAGLEPKPIEARFQELASDQNRKGEALIALDEPVQEPDGEAGKIQEPQQEEPPQEPAEEPKKKAAKK